METGDPTSKPVPTEPSNPEGSPTPQAGGDEAVQSVPPPIIQAQKTKRREIFNKTSLRIAIKSKSSDQLAQQECLIISPFSTKVLSEEAMLEYECERWE